MLGAKSSVLGFSRPTDRFLSVAWRKSVVYGMPAIVCAQRTNSTGKVAKWALHGPAAENAEDLILNGKAKLGDTVELLWRDELSTPADWCCATGTKCSAAGRNAALLVGK